MAPKATPKTAPKPRPFAPTVSMALRPKRAAQPGALDMPQEKRSHEQTQKDKQAEDDKKSQAAAKKKQGIANVAAIENKTAAEDKTRDEQANHPPATSMSKVLRPRPETAPNAATADIVEGEVIDPISDGPGSSDEYQPGEEDEGEQMDPSEDEEGAGPAPKPTGRAKKLPNGAYRMAVDDERKKQAGRAFQNIDDAKTKAGARDHNRSASASSSSGGRRTSRNAETGSEIARGLMLIGQSMSAPIITKADTSHVDAIVDALTADPTLLPDDPDVKYYALFLDALSANEMRTRIFIKTPHRVQRIAVLKRYGGAA
ncbi:hypothetical protein B0H11DRAFT_2228685 [Mycena galericulata]|nr:hypothetical protein B0H11DRAFT_2228685 [Mycena galericulata]